MFKRQSITTALLIFVSAFGASALVAQFTINEISRSSGTSVNHSQFSSGPKVTQASFVSPQINPHAITNSDNPAGALQNQATVSAVAEEDIDLGETSILADGRAEKQ